MATDSITSTDTGVEFPNLELQSNEVTLLSLIFHTYVGHHICCRFHGRVLFE